MNCCAEPATRRLQVCNGVTSIGLATLAQLRRLRVLELSYTEVQVRLFAALIAKLEVLFL